MKLHHWVAATALLLSNGLVHASEISLSIANNGKASVLIGQKGEAFVGQIKELQDYSVIQLSNAHQTREAGAGSGIIGDSAPIGGGRGPNQWGYAEVLVHCNAADIIVYAYDVNGQAIEVDAQQLETSYCPLTK